MQMWITKYALTKGIYKAEGKISEGGFFYPTGYYTSMTVGKEAFEKAEDAKAAAEKMRTKRIESLRKRIKVLEKLTF